MFNASLRYVQRIGILWQKLTRKLRNIDFPFSSFFLCLQCFHFMTSPLFKIVDFCCVSSLLRLELILFLGMRSMCLLYRCCFSFRWCFRGMPSHGRFLPDRSIHGPLKGAPLHAWKTCSSRLLLRDPLRFGNILFRLSLLRSLLPMAFQGSESFPSSLHPTLGSPSFAYLLAFSVTFCLNLVVASSAAELLPSSDRPFAIRSSLLTGCQRIHWKKGDEPPITHWHRPLLFLNQLIWPTVATTVVSLWLTLIVTSSTLLRVLFWAQNLSKVVPLPWCGSPTLKRVSCVRPFRRNEFIRALELVRRLTLTFLFEFNFGSRLARNWCVFKLFERLLFSRFYLGNKQMLLIGKRLMTALFHQLSKLHPM